MTATKIQPGDDTHLTLLMAPHSLNFVTGLDRAALLAYGRDVFAAGLAGATPAAVAGSSEFPHEQMDAMALDRYKVVPSNASMLWSHAVVAGDGTQQLYVGREVECQNMARKFAGAFLDGAFAFHSTAAAPTALAAPALEAPAAPVLHDIDAGVEVMAWLRENRAPHSIYCKMSACLFGDPDKRAALAAAPQAPAAPVGLPWRTGIPPWTDDRSVRVIAVTAHDDFGGVQVHDIRASDFHTDGDGDGAEVARVCTHWAYRDDIWPRADAVAPAAPIPWDNFPAYLIDHCEGQTITEEGLQRALSAMLANPQYAGAAPAAPAVDAARPKEPLCTECGADLKRVVQCANSYLSAEQFDADKLGDWFCECCPKGPSQGSRKHRYFWNAAIAAQAKEGGEA